MKDRLRVIVTKPVIESRFVVGDTGFVDGYIMIDKAPYAIVAVNDQLDIVPIRSLKMLKSGEIYIHDEVIIEDKTFSRKNIQAIIELDTSINGFSNRQTGFIVKLENDECCFGERIPYDSTPSEIEAYHSKWKNKMDKAVRIWKGA